MNHIYEFVLNSIGNRDLLGLRSLNRRTKDHVNEILNSRLDQVALPVWSLSLETHQISEINVKFFEIREIFCLECCRKLLFTELDTDKTKWWVLVNLASRLEFLFLWEQKMSIEFLYANMEDLNQAIAWKEKCTVFFHESTYFIADVSLTDYMKAGFVYEQKQKFGKKGLFQSFRNKLDKMVSIGCEKCYERRK